MRTQKTPVCIASYAFAGDSAAMLLMFGIIHLNLALAVIFACTMVESRQGKAKDGLFAASSI